MVLCLASCNGNGTGDDVTTTVPPDDVNGEDAFWLIEPEVHSPSEVDRTVDNEAIKELYGGKKVAKPDNIVLTSGNQILALEDRGDGSYSIVTCLFDGTDYVKMFDGGRSLIDGSAFGLFPTEYKTGKQSGVPTCRLSGKDSVSGCSFTITCRAIEEASLFEFDVTVIAKSDLDLFDSAFGFYMNGGAEVTYSQMPPSIYGDYYGLGMPAAYLWDCGREAVILFDYTDMEWMGETSNAMPTQYKVMGRKDGSGIFFGLNRLNGNVVRPRVSTEITAKFYLYSGFSEKRTGLDCIAEKALAVAYAHPAKVKWPTVRSDIRGQYQLDWKSVADLTVTGLLNPDAYNMTSLVMSDPMLTSEKRGGKLYLHYA
ncbi:MAG: hypothetical protein J5592_09675, partial [Clostridia bacterium]|nr:hypothetical protein [Clostridia bacterium]